MLHLIALRDGTRREACSRSPWDENHIWMMGPIRRLGTSSNVSKPTTPKPSSTSQVEHPKAPVPRQTTRPFLTFAAIRARPKAAQSLDGWRNQGDQEVKPKTTQSSDRYEQHALDSVFPDS
ncbi:hypothetical protein FRC03_007908 [Tulasnella sp. 419]|nr:hypothetical protein FRC03_007908 [Tulasnella sp. 419]